MSDFFEPGFTYRTTNGLAVDAITFECHAVAPHPTTGARTALGFGRRGFDRMDVMWLLAFDWQAHTWRAAPTNHD